MVAVLPALDCGARVVLHRLRRHHLPDAQPEAPLDQGRWVEQLRLRLLVLRPSGREGRSWLQRGVAQAERVRLERRDALLSRAPLGELVEQPVGQQRPLPRRLRLLRQRALLGLDPASERGEERVVGVEHQGLLPLVGSSMRVDPRRPRDHLLEPGPRADVGQRRHHGHLGRVQPLVGHRHRHQDGRLGQQAEGGERFVGVALG